MFGSAAGPRLDGRWGRAAAAPENDEGRARGPALVTRDALMRVGYQAVPLQPFVPPEQVRVYEPGEVFDLMMLNTPVELDVAEIV